MKVTLSSKDRLMQAINHHESDHVPLYFKWWSRSFLKDENCKWRNQFDRVNQVLSMGLDDTVGFDVPRPLARDVKVKICKNKPAGENWPILSKEYITPKGTLKQVVRQTNDWPHGDDIPLFSDFVVPPSRSVKYLVQDNEDLDPLSCLFRDLDKKEITTFQNMAEKVRDFAEKHQILVECGMWSEADIESAIFGADVLQHLCGFNNVINKIFREPDFIDRLLDIVLEWDMRYLDALLDLGFVDVIVHRGWYENADFWPPKLYKKFLEPRIRKLIEKTHKEGSKFCYIMTMKQMPLLNILKDMGVDILFGIDPVQGSTDLALAKKTVGESICLWGGVNSAVTLNSGTLKEIKKAVSDSINILAPGGGFILSSIDQIFEETPWKNIQIMIDTWKNYEQLL